MGRPLGEYCQRIIRCCLNLAWVMPVHVALALVPLVEHHWVNPVPTGRHQTLSFRLFSNVLTPQVFHQLVLVS